MSFEVRITQAAWADAQRVFEWIRDEKHAPLTAERWFNGWLKRLRTYFPHNAFEVSVVMR